MLGAIKKWWFNRKRFSFAKKFLANPLGLHLANTIREALYTDKTFLGKFLSDKDKEMLFIKTMSDIHALSISNNPLMQCRAYICKHVNILAAFRVPTIKAPPYEDSSGFRGLPGITGEVFQHIDALAKIDETLKEYLWCQDDPDHIKNNPAYVYESLIRKVVETELFLNAANVLRIHLNDYKPEIERDWLKKYTEIEFALCEAKYRKSLGIPDVLEEQSQLGSCAHLFYYAFYDFIMNGKEYPRYEWDELIKKRNNGMDICHDHLN